MIYAIVGTDTKKRKSALAEVAKLGLPSAHLYGEQVSMLEPLIGASSMFGDRVVVHLIQTLEKAEARERIHELLPSMRDSQNVFVLDEPFADANRAKKIEKFAAKLFDAREEKREEASPFALCNAFARRDKKSVWVEWMKLRDLIGAEAVQGALWWKFQSVWSDTLSGRQTKFSKEECEKFGRRILESSILAHRGEKDLKVELERLLLSL